MSACYFWKEGEVITIKKELMAYDAQKQKLENLYCVDTFSTNPTLRYGKFLRHIAWVHVPITEFPPEFRAWLLINL